MVQVVNPFSLLAVEEKPEAPVLAAEKKEKDEKKKQKQKQRPRRRPASSAPKSNSNGGQIQQKGPADSVSVSSSSSLNDVDQTKESKSEEAEKNTKEADHDAEGWQLVQHQTRKKKSPRNGNHPQTQENQGAIVNNQVDVEEGIKQLQEVARGMNGSQGVKPKKPNMNGSARRRLQKNKAGAGQDQQVQATKEAAAADTTETDPFEKKFTVTFTLEEFEKMKKNGHSNKSDEQPHQSAESAEKGNSFKGRYAEKDNSFKGRYAEKDNSFKGRRKQKGGNRFNGDVADVSPATVEKVEEILFTLVPAEFPVLGKAL